MLELRVWNALAFLLEVWHQVWIWAMSTQLLVLVAVNLVVERVQQSPRLWRQAAVMAMPLRCLWVPLFLVLQRLSRIPLVLVFELFFLVRMFVFQHLQHFFFIICCYWSDYLILVWVLFQNLDLLQLGVGHLVILLLLSYEFPVLRIHSFFYISCCKLFGIKVLLNAKGVQRILFKLRWSWLSSFLLLLASIIIFTPLVSIIAVYVNSLRRLQPVHSLAGLLRAQLPELLYLEALL